ncbi:aspartyl/asparaginyl beta-hydroxylase domain-containing protein [Roseateles sp.]|uniref:aspartyl/asparaginyl beta-hydroxylase domain-containing protein n=1 Tax=Roseateles sp. TaxID=1971397 RepID=UPI002E0B0DF1|nr:aspartyl/asparaginyl beta-hydroxylase domain-containing protein [Roseateles sp.]HEV6964832.1 aspartyl/asparaginyl beta-hydroxylase domain-containing protein [Roseateles sp.]
MAERIRLVSQGVQVAPIYWALQAHPELWNQHTARTAPPDSPHHGLDDIWARFGDPERAADGQPHDARWYPSAYLLGIKPLCLDLMRAVDGVELGGVLITRVPAGAMVRPHIDPGWHARRYEKYGVQITSAPGQAFCFDGESLETRPGDVFWFDNQYLHWVTNDTPYERVTMIVCIRKGE